MEEEYKHEEITLGKFEEIMGKLKKHAFLSKEKGKAITEFGKMIKSCKDDRNALMHGDVIDLFKEDDEGYELWEYYIPNLIRLSLMTERHRPVIDEFVSNLENTYSKRAKE